MNILLKSAKIIDANNRSLHLKKRDILIKEGVIDKIAPKINAKGQIKVVVLENLHVSPGWFDSSVSFGEPGYEERETILNGLKTAAKSGFTDIVLNPNTRPAPDSSSDIVFLKKTGHGHAVNLHPLGTLTVKMEGTHLAELFDMQNAGAVGFYDFKQAITNANLLKIALQYSQNFDGLICSFPMQEQIAGKGCVNEGDVSTKLGLKGIPALAEALQIARDLFILEYTGGKLHIPTVSTADSIKLLAEAKKKGLDISSSVALHNLFATDAVLEEFESNYKTMPPLRAASDVKALIKAVQNGTIDYVTTDHTPMDVEEKRIEFDNAGYGTLGLESAFGVLNKIFDTEMAVALLSRGRDRFGIPEKPIKEGHKADLTLFDPSGTYTFTENDILSTSKNSMFLGASLKGRVYGVISNGHYVV